MLNPFLKNLYNIENAHFSSDKGVRKTDNKSFTKTLCFHNCQIKNRHFFYPKIIINDFFHKVNHYFEKNI